MIMDLLFCLLQLIGMSKYMGLNHFGTDSLLRFQLRNKIRQIKQDDQMILWEGIDSLTPEELRNACAERGMRATGLKQVRCFARLCSSRRRRGGRRSRSSSSLFHFPCHPLPHSCFFGCVFVCVPCARDWWLRVEVGTWARAGRDSMHTHHALPSRPLPCTCVALLATYRRSRACCERCALSLSTIKQR